MKGLKLAAEELPRHSRLLTIIDDCRQFATEKATNSAPVRIDISEHENMRTDPADVINDYSNLSRMVDRGQGEKVERRTVDGRVILYVTVKPTWPKPDDTPTL